MYVYVGIYIHTQGRCRTVQRVPICLGHVPAYAGDSSICYNRMTSARHRVESILKILGFFLVLPRYDNPDTPRHCHTRSLTVRLPCLTMRLMQHIRRMYESIHAEEARCPSGLLVYICIHIYIYMHMYAHVYVYIYIYRDIHNFSLCISIYLYLKPRVKISLLLTMVSVVLQRFWYPSMQTALFVQRCCHPWVRRPLCSVCSGTIVPSMFLYFLSAGGIVFETIRSFSCCRFFLCGSGFH